MKTFALLALALVAPTIGLAEMRLKGRVSDSEGAAISGGMVLFHWDPAGSGVGLTTNIGIKENLVIRTKGDGTFEVDLPPGFYDVFVAATAFSPACCKVRIRPGESQELTLRLDVDPLYGAEMGDSFGAVAPKK